MRPHVLDRGAPIIEDRNGVLESGLSILIVMQRKSGASYPEL